MKKWTTTTLAVFAFVAGFASTYSCGGGGSSSSAADYASLLHTHDAADIVSGVLDASALPSHSHSVTRTHYYSITGDHFFPNTDTVTYVTSGTGGARVRTAMAGQLNAPVHLPDGAVVQDITVYYIDNSNRDLIVKLGRKAHTSAGETTMAQHTTSGASGSDNTILSASVAPFTASTVDNQNYGYFVRASCGSWPGDFSLQISGVVIEYQLTEMF